jgi:hypothetical protein
MYLFPGPRPKKKGLSSNGFTKTVTVRLHAADKPPPGGRCQGLAGRRCSRRVRCTGAAAVPTSPAGLARPTASAPRGLAQLGAASRPGAGGKQAADPAKHSEHSECFGLLARSAWQGQ